MKRYQSRRRRKVESLLQLLRRHTNREVQHYLCVPQYPRTLRFAALTVLRERGQT